MRFRTGPCAVRLAKPSLGFGAASPYAASVALALVLQPPKRARRPSAAKPSPSTAIGCSSGTALEIGQTVSSVTLKLFR